MRNVWTTIIALLPLLACCCDPAEDSNGKTPPLVVEGWIEDDGYPVVMVTRAVDLQGEVQDFDKCVEKGCRVSVSDGTQTVLLSGRIDNTYMPPFIYTTTKMKGEIGKTYHLKVETEKECVEADAQLLPYNLIRRLEAVRCEDSDTLYRVVAYADIDKDKNYKFFSRVMNNERRFYSSFIGTFEGRTYDAERGFDVMKGIHDTYNASYTPYYHRGDTVRVKLCTLTPEIYAFWRAYENTVSMSKNMFFTSVEGCPSNIPGALGYWAAYGYSARMVVVK